MTLKNKVGQFVLHSTAGRPVERDLLLTQAFSQGKNGLTQERLSLIRQFSGNLYERTQFAARILLRSLLEIQVPLNEMGAQFTVDNLAAIVNRDWISPKDHTENIRKVIEIEHEWELVRKRNLYNFHNLTSPQLFRETITYGDSAIYYGNLYEARRFWKGFQPSNEDFLTNISLPTGVGYAEALLLGIYWSKGYFIDGRDSLTVNGKQCDLDISRNINMYGDLVAHLLKTIHNYGPISDTSYIKERRTLHGVAHRPFFEINSSAIYTWLRNDLDYPPTTNGNPSPKSVPFDHLSELETRQGFFSGLVAGLGEFDEEGALLFEHRDEKFVRDIANLSVRIGYSPSEIEHRDITKNHGRLRKNPIWHFTILPRDVERILKTDPGVALPHVGLLINPRHYESVTLQQAV